MIGESAELMEEAGLYDVQALNRRVAATAGAGAGAELGPGDPSAMPRVVVVRSSSSTFGSNASGESDISPLTSKTGGNGSWARQMTMLMLVSACVRVRRKYMRACVHRAGANGTVSWL